MFPREGSSKGIDDGASISVYEGENNANAGYFFH
jgi:hypothetical protein